MEDEQPDIDWIRKGAGEEVEYLKLLRAAAWDEYTHSFRWLMASLLAMNGGALLTIFGSDKVGLIAQFYAAGSFAVGAFSALVIAVLEQRSVRSSLAPLQEIIGYWLATQDDGERLEPLEVTLGEKLKKSVAIAKWAGAFGWISASAFLFGCLVVGADWKSAIDEQTEQFVLPT